MPLPVSSDVSGDSVQWRQLSVINEAGGQMTRRGMTSEHWASSTTINIRRRWTDGWTDWWRSTVLTRCDSNRKRKTTRIFHQMRRPRWPASTRRSWWTCKHLLSWRRGTRSRQTDRQTDTDGNGKLSDAAINNETDPHGSFLGPSFLSATPLCRASR